MARLLPFDLEPQFWLRRSKGGSWTVRSASGQSVEKFATRDKAIAYARSSSPTGNCTIFHTKKRRPKTISRPRA